MKDEAPLAILTMVPHASRHDEMIEWYLALTRRAQSVLRALPDRVGAGAVLDTVPANGAKPFEGLCTPGSITSPR